MTGFDWEILDRYLADDLTPAERSQFEAWLTERPERAAQAAAFRRAITALADDVSDEDREKMWATICGRSGPSTGARQGMPPPSRPLVRPRWQMATGLAAGLLVAVGATLIGRAWLTAGWLTKPVAERIVTVPRAQQAQFRLSDGTVVILGSGSTLRQPQAFGQALREVTLQGEAYFSVEHDSLLPFRVRAGDLIATDMGTEFLVRAYPEDGRTRVVVRSGQVTVLSATARASTERGLVVHPGELGRLDLHGQPVVEPADTAEYFAWTRGILVFDGTPLREALPQLSRWYDLDFRLADTSLGSIPLSGTLDRTLTDHRLDLLAGSLGLRQTRTGHVVTFWPTSMVHPQRKPRSDSGLRSR